MKEANNFLRITEVWIWTSKISRCPMWSTITPISQMKSTARKKERKKLKRDYLENEAKKKKVFKRKLLSKFGLT